jgi:hypothetical protein
MLRRLDRFAIAVVSLAVGLQAIVPGWQIMTDGSVYGFKLPESWLTGFWPFSDFFIAGLILAVVIGGGGLVTAAVAAFSDRDFAIAGFLMGLVIVGWIGGELVFINQTMVMTWVILGSGLLLIALSAPYALPALKDRLMQGGRRQTA